MSIDPAPVDPSNGDSAPVFDRSVLYAFLGEDEHALASVLQTFLSSMTESMLALQAAWALRDLAAVAKLAHRIKGAAFMSGALAMARTAQQLEHIAGSADMLSIGAATVLLEESWRALQSDPGLQGTLAGG